MKEPPAPVTTPILSITSGPPSISRTGPLSSSSSSPASTALATPPGFLPHQPIFAPWCFPNGPPISSPKALAIRMQLPTSGWLSNGRWQEYSATCPSISLRIFRKCRPVTGCNPFQKSPWCTISRSAPRFTASLIVASEASTATATCPTSPGPSTCMPFSA